MQSDLSIEQSHASTWSWFALVLLLAFAIFWALSDVLRLRLELYLFIPLLTGWLANRLGFQLVSFLLALAAITVFSLGPVNTN